MKPSVIKSPAIHSPGNGQPGAELPDRPNTVRLWIITTVLVAMTVALFFASRPKASSPAVEAEIAPSEPPVSQEPVAKVARVAQDTAKPVVLSPSGAVVDPRGPVVGFASESTESMADHWGIEITQVGVALRGAALDLRYKVVDATKASSLLYLTNLVYIYNQSNNKVLMVPFQRENQTSQKLVAGKTYFTLLPNKEGRVESGSRVTVVLGGSRTEGLVVN